MYITFSRNIHTCKNISRIFRVFFPKEHAVKNIVGYYYCMLIYHISRYIHVYLQGLEIKDKGCVCLSTARKRRVE